jgi:pantoate--beta-alanine ligase
MSQVFENINDWKSFRKSQVAETIGLVPTMGSLHAGHLALVSRSRAENDRTCVSIFVNPTQFNDPQDFARYPRDLSRDLTLLREQGVDYILLPSEKDIYRDRYSFQLNETELSQKLCGAHRPGHFQGVLTIVLKLINLTAAQRIYMGEKDYQQFVLIREMVQALFLPTEVISVPTVREPDGLALSSRNLRLSDSERVLAPELSKTLRTAATNEEAFQRLTEIGFRVEYVETFQGRRCAAAFLGSVRLIDNVLVPEP